MRLLLLSIPRPVIEALIDNTIGYRYVNDPEFARLVSGRDRCAGVYIKTFVVTKTGKGLNINQLEGLRATMRRYIDSKGVVITDSSTEQQKDNAFEAAKIEYISSLGKGEDSFRYFYEQTERGIRNMLPTLVRHSEDQFERFIKELENRIRRDLDRYGIVPQLQSPIEVGCTEHLGTGTCRYIPDEQLPSLFSFVIGCLETMGIACTPIALPVLVVWDANSLEMAEILVAELASSQVEYGGIRTGTVGRTSFHERRNMEKEVQEVFYRSRYLQQNTEAGIEVMKRQEELMEEGSENSFEGNVLQHLEGALEMERRITAEMEQKYGEIDEEDPRTLEDEDTGTAETEDKVEEEKVTSEEQIEGDSVEQSLVEWWENENSSQVSRQYWT